MTESNIKILMNTCTFINSPLMVTYHIMDNGGVLVNSLGFKIFPKINIIIRFVSDIQVSHQYNYIWDFHSKHSRILNSIAT
jgi:hypothetical protein